MAKAELHALHPANRPRVSEADLLLAEIQRLYRELRDLPSHEKPEAGQVWRTSLAYTALETRIRWHADRYKVLKAQEERAC